MVGFGVVIAVSEAVIVPPIQCARDGLAPGAALCLLLPAGALRTVRCVACRHRVRLNGTGMI
jgi:hypothetical protein